MAAISNPTLPPKRGYIEKENPITKERYYERVNTSYLTETALITESQIFTVPEAKDQKFQVKLIGAGGAYANSTNGQDGEVIIKDIIIDKDKTVQISIGIIGVNNSNGGTTSFGEYFCALGGLSGYEKSPETTIHNENYGKGGTVNTSPSNGVCIITYQKPIIY